MILKKIFPLILCLLTGCNSFIDYLGGNFDRGPLKPITSLSPEAQELVQKAYQGVDHPYDHHVHLIGKDGGNYVNPKMQSLWHPLDYFKYRLYISAGGITDMSIADEQYVERLVNLIHAIPNHGKHNLFAMDKHYKENGQADLEHTPFYIPNESVMRVAEKYPDCFVPVISVHPYRLDALEELEKWAKQGVRFVKWLPNSMNIDPSHPKTTAFYEMMVKYDMILLTHTSDESAVSAELHHLGNPLLLRAPLNAGVQVVALHMATDGVGEDLDNPGTKKTYIELLLRLFDEYPNNLWGEISAITVWNRMEHLYTLLERIDLHPRLINGSDYPIPAINSTIWLGRLARKGFITKDEKCLLQEIYKYNPLLFDFVLKRTIRHPKNGNRFADSIFGSPF